MGNEDCLGVFSVSELSEHYIRTLNQQNDSREHIQARQPRESPKNKRNK